MRYCVLFFTLLSLSCSKYVDHCPDFIIPEKTLSWFNPYEDKSFKIFESEQGDTDTIWIERKTINDTCVENVPVAEFACTRPCVTEYVRFYSKKNLKLIITMKAVGTELLINFENSRLKARFDVVENKVNFISSPDCIEYQQYSGHSAEELWLFCCKGEMCEQLADISEFNLSKSQGLVEFDTKGGVKWKIKK